MYKGFFLHSPLRAHAGQFGSSSTHSLVARLDGNESKERTWIHLVADHFSPSMTGQLPCKLVLSVVASGWRLKNSRASPFIGFTVQTRIGVNIFESRFHIKNHGWFTWMSNTDRGVKVEEKSKLYKIITRHHKIFSFSFSQTASWVARLYSSARTTNSRKKLVSRL